MTICCVMNTPGEKPQFDIDMPLPRAEIERFRDEEILPAIDYLAGREFVRTAALDDYISINPLRQENGEVVSIELMAKITTVEYDEDTCEHGGERICVVDITISKTNPDLLPELYFVATGVEQGPRGGFEAGELLAWDVWQHSFSTSEDTLWVGNCWQSHLLTERNYAVYWSDEEGYRGGYDSPEEPITEQEEEIFEELDNELSATTATQRRDVRWALGQLGVPPELLFEN